VPGIPTAKPHSASPELLANVVRELTDRLRALPESRLVGRPDGATVGRAELAGALARRFVAWAHGVEHREHAPSAAPELPSVGLFVTADQVAVAGADLVAAAAGLPADTPVWDAGRRVPLGDVLAAALAAVAELRALL
jgi:hypothetical protein